MKRTGRRTNTLEEGIMDNSNNWLMNDRHKRCLSKCRLALARGLDLSEVTQFLVQENILTDRMVEKIESKCTRFGQNVAFLNLLPTRGPTAYKKFIDGLKETEQKYLADMLECQDTVKSSTSRCPVTEPPRNVQLPSASLVTETEHDGATNIVVEKTTKEFYRANFQRGYKMCSRPRGFALIVNVTEFDHGVPLLPRKGGNYDKENLSAVLLHLGFEILLVENKTAIEITTSLRQFANKDEHQYRDGCVIALLTHGKEDAIYGRDGNEIKVENIVTMFDNANCPNLRNKPKIFFIQACRGDEYDRGIDENDGGSRDKNRGSGCVATSSPEISFDNNRLPTRSDMIFGYATLQGQAAMRNTHHGSWYIEALVKVLARYAKNKDLAEMLTIVNSVIRGKQCHSPGSDLHNCKEMSVFHSTLCKKLYFFPGIYQANY